MTGKESGDATRSLPAWEVSTHGQPKTGIGQPGQPSPHGLDVLQGLALSAYQPGIVAALTPPSWDVALIDENWEPHRRRPADMVGITAFTASAGRAYQIAGEYRRLGTPVVMGGIHASMCTEEALRYVDTVVIGEAEAVWPRILEDFERGRLQRVYQGEWNDLQGTPRPRRDLFHPGYQFASVQTSRGCPMDCDFCSVAAFNGRRYRRRPPDEVLAELEGIPQKQLFFVDDNLIGYGKESRDQALALFKGMVERKMDKWWFCQASLNIADDEEVLYWAGRAGCKMVFIGLEAEDSDALAQVNKRLNLKRGVGAYGGAFRRIQAAGIAVLGAFIFGIDGDTVDKLELRARYMVRSDIDVMQATYLTPLPGTRLYQRYQGEGRLLYTDYPRDWDRYDMSEVTHRPTGMEPELLAATMQRLNRSIYAWPVLLSKAARTLWRTRRLTTLMFAWGSNTRYRGLGRSWTGVERTTRER